MQYKEKILYTKYSNDRDKQFRIITHIIDDGKKRFIRKKAACEEAKTHINSITFHEKDLATMFSGTKFAVNKIISQGDDFIDFEYVEGVTYDKYLDEFLKKNDEDGFKKAVSDFFIELDNLATAEFQQNEKTVEIFGKNAFTEGEKAIPVS